MVELLVAILIALGSLTSRDQYNDEYINSHRSEVSSAQQILDNQQYHVDERTGGVIVDTGIGT